MVAATLRALSCGFAALGLYSGLTVAQSTKPLNETDRKADDVEFIMDITLDGVMPNAPPLAPLTDDAGRQGNLNHLEAIQHTGPLYLTTPDTVKELHSGFVSLVSCDSQDYPGPSDPTQLLRQARDADPSAIVLYSTRSARCVFQPTNNFYYDAVYTLTAANISDGIVRGLQEGTYKNPRASIHVNQDSVNSTNSSGGSVLSKSPTTAVAMIILYSITGIITALFLIIIVVGAIRAHRHPERYGPRHVVGRQRQSRARGIARAMLDTIPIVKFGDKEGDKPNDTPQDVEIAMSNTNANAPEGTSSASAPPKVEEQPSHGASASDGPDLVKTETADNVLHPQKTNQTSSNPIEDGLACSVCTDDFVKGQDIRLLPCKHKFHPECIDPWLLNVSGTCPLCRIELQPTTSNEDPNPDDHVPSLELREIEAHQDTEGTPNDARRHRRSRILSTLNIGRMRQATPQERLEALRTLREANASSNEDGPRNRFSRRLSRALGSRPPSGVVSRPVSGIPAGASGALHPDVTTASDRRDGDQAPGDRRREGSFAG